MRVDKNSNSFRRALKTEKELQRKMRKVVRSPI